MGKNIKIYKVRCIQHNPVAFHLGHGHHYSHCNAWSCVTLFVTRFAIMHTCCGYMYYTVILSVNVQRQLSLNVIILSLNVRRQAERNKLLAQVAKRTERAQLLVPVHISVCVSVCYNIPGVISERNTEIRHQRSVNDTLECFDSWILLTMLTSRVMAKVVRSQEAYE